MTKSNRLFHFIISNTINCQIDYLKENLNIKSNCKLFDYILKKISKNMPKLKEIIGDHKSEYDFVDTEDISRIHKYVRLNENKYKMLKKWHYLFNEYGISVILRDIIKFFYEGLVKYGVEKFLNLIENNLNFHKIKYAMKNILTHMMRISIKKRLLYSIVVQNLIDYS